MAIKGSKGNPSTDKKYNKKKSLKNRTQKTSDHFLTYPIYTYIYLYITLDFWIKKKNFNKIKTKRETKKILDTMVRKTVNII